ncbi:dihydroorotase [Sulfurimonas sp. SAG-AH-194-I05]|nr:dihydroorotase [Sulfurimonas sp. SAG-AH-194-I05]MDF1874727.1 dihydroorotase [Sulfurimonas sp. SAG-AH-194-I05]
MLIKNAIICDIYGERKSDIQIDNGKIIAIGNQLQDTNVIDAKGAYVLPLLVDLNIQLQDTILNAKNIQKVSKEALLGGVGHVVLNANTTPFIDNEIVLEFAQNGLKDIKGAKIDLTLNTLKEDFTLSDIAILLKKGVLAPFMSTIAKNDIAIKIAEYVQMYKVTLFCKAEDNSLISSGVMLDGNVSTHLGLAGIPDLSEVLHVSRMIEIARHFKIKILFKSIASPRSISLITQAKKDGVAVSCEVSIHHLLKSDEACENFNTTAKLNPPLACEKDRLLLQDALKNNEIDCLTTLHQPSSLIHKEVAFFDADYGCEALCDALPLYYTKLVKSGLISMTELVKLTTQNPASNIGKVHGSLNVGDNADILLFNPHATRVINNKQSLYDKEKLYGEVIVF